MRKATTKLLSSLLALLLSISPALAFGDNWAGDAMWQGDDIGTYYDADATWVAHCDSGWQRGYDLGKDSIDIEDGSTHAVSVVYVAATKLLAMNMDGTRYITTHINIPQKILGGTNYAYISWHASTGGANNLQTVGNISWNTVTWEGGSGPGTYNVNGNASGPSSGTYTLTTATNSQDGTVTQTTRVDFSQNFDLSFDLAFGSSDAGADGIDFQIQNQDTTSSSGYMSPGLTIRWDTYDNGRTDNAAFEADNGAKATHTNADFIELYDNTNSPATRIPYGLDPIDSSAGPGGDTFTQGDYARLNAVEKKFGTSSCMFDGTNDYFRWDGMHTLGDFGTGDFTVDAWVNMAADGSGTLPTANSPSIVSGVGPINGDWMLAVDTTAQLRWGRNFISWDCSSSALSWTAGTWYHVAVTRSSGTTRLFRDGSVVATCSSDTNSYNLGTNDKLQIGARQGTSSTTTSGNFWRGWIDEVRIVKGKAMWTAAFTPPTEPYGPGN